MTRTLIVALAIFSFLAVPALATDNYLERIRVIQKVVVDDNNRIRVIAVETSGYPYYYEVNKIVLRQQLEDDIVDRISENVSNDIIDELIKILEEVLGKNNGETPPENPDTPSEPEPDEPPVSDLDAQAMTIFKK